MANNFQLECPECGLHYQLDRAMIGAKVKCTECGVKFIAHDSDTNEVIPVAAPAGATASASGEVVRAKAPQTGGIQAEAIPAQDAESQVARTVVRPADDNEDEPAAKPLPESKPEETSVSDAKADQDSQPAQPTQPTQPTAAPSGKRRKQRRNKQQQQKPANQPEPAAERPASSPTAAPVAKAGPAPAAKADPAPTQPEPNRAVQHRPPPDPNHFAAVDNIAQIHKRILDEVGKVIVGQRDVIDQVLTAFFARGNCLLKGVPGLAKTLLVNTLADAMALQFHRIQFTPDLMPTDITGTNILEEDPSTGKRIFTFRKGPVFTNLLLADEINRTPPKTQAALLEAMQEKQVTSGERLYRLPDPFLVLATQNPIEQEGTYTLPEAQLDRFIFMVNVGYPNEQEEMQILLETTRDQQAQVRHVLDAAGILKIQEIVRSIPVTEHVAGYASRLVRATRPEDPTAPDFIKNWLHFGCGPRAGQSLLLAAKAHAALNGRTVVACDDIREYALPTLRHRLVLNFAAAAEGLTPDDVIKKLLDHVKEKTTAS